MLVNQNIKTAKDEFEEVLSPETGGSPMIADYHDKPQKFDLYAAYNKLESESSEDSGLD